MTAEVTAGTILAKTAKGAGWIIGWRMVTRILGLLSTLFLVRLLLPADFGLVTLAASFGQAADSMSSLGVEEAVIREEHPTRALYDSAFTINVIRGLATAAIVAAAAWPVGWFFSDTRLIPVMLALAAGAVATAFENIGIVDFRRNIEFEKEFVLMAVPRIVSILITITLAFILRSYWALVAGVLTGTVLRTGMSYVMHPLRPWFGLQAWRQIASFSFWSWLLSLASLVRDRCDAFVVGRMLDVAQVGVFSLGVEIASLPTTEFVSPLGRACFSGFAAARNAGMADTGTAFLRVLGSAMLVALPAGFGVSLVADPIVKLAFGREWLGATIVIEVLGVALSVTAVGMISMALLNAYAVLQEMFWVQVASIAIRLPLTIVLIADRGLAGAALSSAIATAIEHLICFAMSLRRLRLNAAEFLRHTWRAMAGTAAMTAGMAASGLGWVTVEGDATVLAVHLVCAVAAGFALYAGVVATLWLGAGRPSAAESDLAEMVLRMGRRVASVMRRQARSVL